MKSIRQKREEALVRRKHNLKNYVSQLQQWSENSPEDKADKQDVKKRLDSKIAIARSDITALEKRIGVQRE